MENTKENKNMLTVNGLIEELNKLKKEIEADPKIFVGDFGEAELLNYDNKRLKSIHIMHNYLEKDTFDKSCLLMVFEEDE